MRKCENCIYITKGTKCKFCFKKTKPLSKNEIGAIDLLRSYFKTSLRDSFNFLHQVYYTNDDTPMTILKKVQVYANIKAELSQ